jgi:magnesium transporter
MITGYAIEGGRLRLLDAVPVQAEAAAWIDLLRPTADEERALEADLGIAVPSREEMAEIEVSSRLYTEDEAAFMTALILSNVTGDDAVISPVTFVLAGRRLLTVRHEEPKVFPIFAGRAQKASIGCTSADAVLVGLLEAIVDRLADVVERCAHEIDAISHNIFSRAPGKKPTRSRDFQAVLESLGRRGDLVSNIRESIVTLDRLFSFLAHVAVHRKSDKDLRTRIKTLSRDARSLSDHVSFLSQKITFLLDATLGMINIEQNAIIKIFSVAAVVFLPPTLIASIYGMNFKLMPERDWEFGYPLAIGLMILSAILPYLFFKRKGWL